MSSIFGTSSGNLLADRRFDYAQDMAERGDFAGASDLFDQARALAPTWPPLSFHLGDALQRQGRNDEASAAYATYLTLDPSDHMGAAVKLALIENTSPDAMPDAYIAALFDDYAPRFDHALINNLHYKTPWQIRGALDRIAPGREFAKLLDLGCGTGLAAEVLKDRCAYKIGVDLSPGMVDQARMKRIYDALIVDTLDHYLSLSADKVDLIVAADVFVYIGDLAGIIQSCADHLVEGGLFAFSVQRCEGGDFTLGADHRYAHSLDYIQSCTTEAGLTISSHENAILRKDGEHDVEGIIFITKST